MSTHKKAIRNVIEEKQVALLSTNSACRYLGICRQAYYQQRARAKVRRLHEQEVLNFVDEERRFQPRIGTRKLKYMMCNAQLYIGRDHLFHLLREHHLLVPNKPSYHKTTQSHHRFHCHPNVIKSGYKPEQREQLWVADITYLPTVTGHTYLSVVTDAYSRKIVGYHLDSDMKASTVKKAFEQALKQRLSASALIHHSDRGIQYCSGEYQALHELWYYMLDD